MKQHFYITCSYSTESMGSVNMVGFKYIKDPDIPLNRFWITKSIIKGLKGMGIQVRMLDILGILPFDDEASLNGFLQYPAGFVERIKSLGLEDEIKILTIRESLEPKTHD